MAMVLPTTLFAQVGNEKYEKGTIYLVSGDTLEVTIKPDKAERLSKQISVWDSQNMGAKRYLPKDLDGFFFQNETYKSKKDAEGKRQFMVELVKGEVSLYSHTYKEEKGKEEVVTVYYLDKKGTGFTKVPSNKNKFRTEMSYYFADDMKLAQKIDDKMYQYNDIEMVVDEYNETKTPKKTVADEPKKEDPKVENNEPNQPDNNQPEKPTQNVQPDNDEDPFNASDYTLLKDNSPKGLSKSVGIEALALVSYSMASYPNTLNSMFNVKSGGVGFEVGIGFRATVSRGLTFRTGINMKDKTFKFQSSSLQVQDQNGNITVLTVNEKGRTYYPGVYFNIGQEWKYFMIGGGFNMSFYSMYKGKYDYKGGPYDFSENNAKGSFMVHNMNKPDKSEGNFNMQFDVNLTAGARFAIGDRVTLKPIIQYAIPLISLYNSGIMVQGSTGNVELNVNIYTIKAGLIVDFGNW